MKHDIASDFLYWNALGQGGFPSTTVYIGIEFEACSHEDFDFVVVEMCFDKERSGPTYFNAAYTRKRIAAGRTLEKALEAAKQYYKTGTSAGESEVKNDR